jgi:signal transduction histidine kinase
MTDQSLYIGIVLVTLIILLLIASVIISVFLSNRQRLKQDVRLSELKLLYEKELRHAELELAEQLMTHIGRELHDNVGHTLLNMQLIIENQKIDNPEKSPHFNKLAELLGQSIEQLRMLSRSLSHDYFSDLTFQEAIHKEIERLEAFSPMKVDYLPGTRKYETLDKDQLLMSYRIFQEVINNIVRHSKATSIAVRSNFNDYLLKIDDNGVGFDVEEMLNSSKGAGLKNISKRAMLAGLDLKIESSINKGTTVTLSLPKSEPNELK